MNNFRSNNDSLKYQRFTLSDCKDIEIVESECVAKILFLSGFSGGGNEATVTGHFYFSLVLKVVSVGLNIIVYRLVTGLKTAGIGENVTFECTSENK